MLQMICTVNVKLFCFLFSVKSTATDCRCVRLLPIFHLLESRALCWEAIWQWNIIAKMVRTLLSQPSVTYDVTLHFPYIKHISDVDNMVHGCLLYYTLWPLDSMFITPVRV